MSLPIIPNQLKLSPTINWIKNHTPKASTVAVVALQAIALTGVALATIYFPITTMAIGAGGYIAFRFYIEYVQQKFDESIKAEVNIHRLDYNDEHTRMLKAVKAMQAIAKNRHIAQVVSLATVIVFWRIKAPLVILSAGIAGVVLALDYFDTKNCLQKLKNQVQARIYNNPALNTTENTCIRALYPHDDDIQLAQKLEIERECRPLRMKYTERVDVYTAEAYAYLLGSGKYTIAQGAEEPEMMLPLGQLSVIYELESSDDNSKYHRSSLLRPRLKAIQQIKRNYQTLTITQKDRLKQRIINPENFTGSTGVEEQLYRDVCQLWQRRISANSFFIGAEKYHLKKFKVIPYLKSIASDWINLLHSPGEPRTFKD